MIQPGTFTKEQRLTLKDKAMIRLREAILSGKLRPGSRLIEQELSDMMGISRFPLREAIAGLEQEGLITIEPYKGGYVSKPSAVEIGEVYSVRELLEAHALELLMKKNDGEALARLHAIVDSMDTRNPLEGTNFMHADFAFHNAICEAAGNVTLHKMWLTLSTKIQIYINMELHSESITILKKNHKFLCTVIESGDVAAAVDELRGHLRRGRQSLLGTVE